MVNSLIIRQESVQVVAQLHLSNNTLIIQRIYAYNNVQLTQIIFHKIKLSHASSHVLALLQCLLTIQPENVCNIVPEAFSKPLLITPAGNAFLYAQMAHLCRIQPEHANHNVLKALLILEQNSVLLFVHHTIMDYSHLVYAYKFALQQLHNCTHRTTLTCVNHHAG